MYSTSDSVNIWFSTMVSSGWQSVKTYELHSLKSVGNQAICYNFAGIKFSGKKYFEKFFKKHNHCPVIKSKFQLQGLNCSMAKITGAFVWVHTETFQLEWKIFVEKPKVAKKNLIITLLIFIYLTGFFFLVYALFEAANLVYREESAQNVWMATRIFLVRAVLCVLVMAMEAWVKFVIRHLVSALVRWGKFLVRLTNFL